MKIFSVHSTVISIVAIAFSMVYLDITVLSVGLPSIQKSFSSSGALVLWVVDSYMLMRAVLVFASGRLSDIFDPFKTFLLGLIIFSLASLTCGLAPSIYWLILFRALQGVGATFIFVPGMSLITSQVEESKRGRAIGFVLSIGLASMSVGPVLGGLIIAILSWQWIFYLNAIVALLAIILLSTVKNSSETHNESRYFDWAGFVLSVAFTLCINVAFEMSASWGWASTNFLLLIIIGILVAIAFIYVEKRQTHPIVDLKLFSLPNFSSSCLIASFVQISVLLVVYLGIFFQNALGYTPLVAGLMLLPMVLTGVIFSNVGGCLVDKYDVRFPLILGTGAIVLGFLLTLLLFKVLSYLIMLPLLILSGAGMFMISGPVRTAMLMQTPKNKHGMTNSILTGIRSIVSVIGFAVVGAIISNIEFYQAKSRLLVLIPDISTSQIQVLLNLLSKTNESKTMLVSFAPSLQPLIKNIILESYINGVFWGLFFVGLLMLTCFFLAVFAIKKPVINTTSRVWSSGKVL